MKIGFFDSVNGATIKVPLTYYKVCSHCNGSGAENPSDLELVLLVEEQDEFELNLKLFLVQ